MDTHEYSLVRMTDRIARDLHDLLSQDDMEHIEVQFNVKQVLRQGVTFDEFLDIIYAVLPFPTPISEDHIKSIFTKIDTYSTGLIDWNGFISYILIALQRDEVASLDTEYTIHPNFRAIKVLRLISGPNRDVIQRIDIMPQIHPKTREITYSSYRYVTASKDGIIAVWSQKWTLQKYKQCRNPPSALRQKIFPWIMDMVCIPNTQMIATCGTDETIRFYDIINANMDLLIMVTMLQAIPTCMNFWFDVNDKEHSVLIFGDRAGSVTMLEFYKSVSRKLFGLQTGYDIQKVKLQELLKKQTECVGAIHFPKIHDEWVRQVKYTPDMKSFVSCSMSSKSSIAICAIVFDLNIKFFEAPKGISSFDYSTEHNIIVSGSIDRCVRVWNPYINKKPIAILSGHSAPVQHILIINEKFQAVSVSEDKCIKVWDLKELICIQTLYDRAYKWGSHSISSALHDPFNRLIALGSVKIIIIERLWPTESTDKTLFATHGSPLLGIGYSWIYGYVVSVSDDGTIIFWDLESGARKVQVALSHATLVDGIEVPNPITAMSMDENGRRLFTAGGDGKLKVWSMTNGSFLKAIKLPEGKDINAILAAKGRIFFGGWTKRVYVCNDELHLETMRMWPVHHTDDITAIAFLPPYVIATSSWDGKVMTWMMETGQQLSVWSLQHQFVYTFMPKLRSLAEWQILGCHAMDIVEFSELQSDSELSQKSSSILQVMEQRSKRKLCRNLPHHSASCQEMIAFPAIKTMIALGTRMEKPHIACVIASDTDGFIQMWSTSRVGGLVALFCNSSEADQYTYCLTTDVANRYLFTGDTFGYVRVWYIKYFYSGDIEIPEERILNDIEPFPFSTKRLQPARERVLNELNELPLRNHLRFANKEYPNLISSFRGHLKTIVQITIIESKFLIMTASKDKSLRIWTYSGAYLRTLGDTREFSLSKALTTPILPMERKVPADITKVASGPTLQVILQGVSPQWHRLRRLILNTYVKSVTRRKTESSRPPELEIKPVEDRKLSLTERLQAQELVFSKMQQPLGDRYDFKTNGHRQKTALPEISDNYKEMNCVYAYLRSQPLNVISLESAYPYLESHRLASRLKSPGTPTYEH